MCACRKSHVVGTVNRGWDVAKYLLQHERAMISGMGERGVGRPLGQVAADSIGADEQGRLDDAGLRSQIANFEVDEAALSAAAERMVDLAKAGQAHPAFSSAMKYYGTELNKRRYEILMSIRRHRRAGVGERALPRRRAPARLAAHQGQLDRGRHLGGDARHRRQAHPRFAGGVTHTFTARHSGARRSLEPGIHTHDGGYGFRAWPFGPSRNDDLNEISR